MTEPLDAEQRVAWRETLARKYPTQEEARQFIDRVGLKPDRIAFQPRADLTWFSILEEARKQGGLWSSRILDCALEDYPDDEALRRLREGFRVRFLVGKQPGAWKGRAGPALEKIIGKQSTLVPVSFLERGLQCTQAVVRILCADGGYGSGFLIEDDLLVTNNHVIRSPEEAGKARVEFNFQKLLDGRDASVETVECEPGSFFLTSQENDFTVVKLRGNPSQRWRPLRLEKASVRADDRVNIIQHPGGKEKQLSYFHNIVAFAGSDRVQYLTDTLPGSSGSPVFDKEWRVVAVHHSGDWLPEPGTSSVYYRNEGIDINVVLQAIEAKRAVPDSAG